jgi:hypothetical protein
MLFPTRAQNENIFCYNLWLNFRKPINSSGKAKIFSLFLES